MQLKRLAGWLVSEQLRSLRDKISYDIWASNLNTARIKYGSVTDTSEIGFSCYSQSNEDGILDFLATRIGFNYESSFLEIGTQDYAESNTRFLYTALHCRGTIVDSCSRYKQRVKKTLGDTYWKGRIRTIERFVTLNNISSVLDSRYDLVSLDIDGNDFWILSEILQSGTPKILVCEYNPLFGYERVTTPYREEFDRKEYHYSHLVFGMSLALAIELAHRHGLVYVGSNDLHNNAFFVRRDCLSYLPESFVIPKAHKGSKECDVVVQEARDAKGNLHLMDEREIIDMVGDVEVCRFKEYLDGYEFVQMSTILK